MQTVAPGDMSGGQSPTPSDAVEQKDTVNRALAAIETLPKDQQEVVLLKFQNGLSYAEISRITGHSVSNVGYLIHVGIRAVRAHFESADTSMGRAS